MVLQILSLDHAKGIVLRMDLETSADMLDAELRRLKMPAYSKRPAKISIETLHAWVRCSGRPREREERTI